MNVVASECSSGCESGWTLYLEEHSHRNPKFFVHGNPGFREEYDGGEGLSMVSDASSGPPHFHEDDEGEAYFNGVNGHHYSASKAAAAAAATATATLPEYVVKKQKMKDHRRCRRGEKQELPSSLDDTASSPVINFSSSSKKNQGSMESFLDYSQALSATHLQGRSSALQDQFGFLQSSLSGKTHLQNNQWL